MLRRDWAIFGFIIWGILVVAAGGQVIPAAPPSPPYTDAQAIAANAPYITAINTILASGCLVPTFTLASNQVIASMTANPPCTLGTKQLGVTDISGMAGITTVHLLSGITITPGTISVGTYNESQSIAGILSGDQCIAAQTSTPILGTTSLGLIQGTAAGTGKVFFGNSGLIGVSLGSFTASLLCVHS